MWEGMRTMSHLWQSSNIFLDSVHRGVEAREPWRLRQARAVVLSDNTFIVFPLRRGRKWRRVSLIVSSSFQFIDWLDKDWGQMPSTLWGRRIPHHPNSEASVITIRSGGSTCMGTGVLRRSGLSQGCKAFRRAWSTGTGESLRHGVECLFIHFMKGRRYSLPSGM